VEAALRNLFSPVLHTNPGNPQMDHRVLHSDRKENPDMCRLIL